MHLEKFSLENKLNIWAIGSLQKTLNQFKKVEDILKIKALTTRKELPYFIGKINYYLDMQFCRSEILVRLTSQTISKVKFEWFFTINKKNSNWNSNITLSQSLDIRIGSLIFEPK
jgi:hypothetical protein